MSCIFLLVASCISSHEPSSHPTQSGTCPSNAGVAAACGVVPHDECTDDAACGPDAVCSCQAPIPAGQACPSGVPLVEGNVCISANCRVDGDCARGSCLTEYVCGSITGFYCATSSDDCSPAAPGTSYDGNGCVFRSGRWQLQAVACPG